MTIFIFVLLNYYMLTNSTWMALCHMPQIMEPTVCVMPMLDLSLVYVQPRTAGKRDYVKHVAKNMADQPLTPNFIQIDYETVSTTGIRIFPVNASVEVYYFQYTHAIWSKSNNLDWSSHKKTLLLADGFTPLYFQFISGDESNLKAFKWSMMVLTIEINCE